ncbi:MAG: sigma-70 family RNA polymerase sigma factor [Algicola sp.]|nr:sigma-70 family RNA polymerase sigma factor [Algicola sp.]
MDKIGVIYNSNIDDLFAYGIRLGFNKEEVMDAIHNIFHKIMLKSTLNELVNVKSYLFKSLRNELFNEFKRSRRITLVGGDDLTMPFELQVNVEELLIEDEFKAQLKSKIEKTLQKITPRQREIIYLRYTQEYGYQEISEILGIGVPACRNLILKALKQLRDSDVKYYLFLCIRSKQFNSLLTFL